MSFFGLVGSPNVEKLKANRDIKGLIKALSYQKDARIRQAAVKAIKEVAEVNRVASQLSEAGAPSILTMIAFDDPDEQVRNDAIEVLKGYGTGLLVKEIQNRLESSDNEKRVKARKLLLQLGSTIAGYLLIGLRRHNAEDVAKFILNEISMEALIDAINEKIGKEYVRADESVALKKGAVEILTTIGKANISLLAEMLKDDHYKVRHRILEALTEIPGDQAQRLLISLLEGNDSNLSQKAWKALEARKWQPTNDRQRAFVAVAKYNFEECIRLGEIAVEPLVYLLEAKDINFSKWAAQALGKLRSKRAIAPLVKSLGDQYYEIQKGDTFSGILSGTGAAPRNLVFPLREKAADAILEIGDANAIAPLTTAIMTDLESTSVALAVLEKLLAETTTQATTEELQKVANLPENVAARIHKIGTIRGDGSTEVLIEQHLLSCTRVKTLAYEELNRRSQQP